MAKRVKIPYHRKPRENAGISAPPRFQAIVESHPMQRWMRRPDYNPSAKKDVLPSARTVGSSRSPSSFIASGNNCNLVL
jgi:hypothetical protein